MVFTSKYFQPKSGCQGEKGERRHISCEEIGTILTWDISSTIKCFSIWSCKSLKETTVHWFHVVNFCAIMFRIWSGVWLEDSHSDFPLCTSRSTRLAGYVANIFIVKFGKPSLAKYSQVMPQTCAHWQLFPWTVLTMKVHFLDQQVHLSV